MMPDDILERYELLIEKADLAFEQVERDHRDCVACRIHCSDCCHAVFGVFLIEAAYLQRYFSELKQAERRAASRRADESDRDLEEIQKRLAAYADDPQMSTLALSRERMACPLLNQEQECVLYPRRPITCRVYGIPTAVQGKLHVCNICSFKDGETYPTFDLDAVYKALYVLSKELREEAGQGGVKKASYLISVSKAIRTPMKELLNGSLD